jgi:hypothetical protein
VSQLDRPRIRVDFNELTEQDVVLVSRLDDVVDSAGNTITLREGLRVYLYCEDADDSGKPTYLVASGLIEQNTAADWSQKVKWRCRIDAWGELPRTG